MRDLFEHEREFDRYIAGHEQRRDHRYESFGKYRRAWFFAERLYLDPNRTGLWYRTIRPESAAAAQPLFRLKRVAGSGSPRSRFIRNKSRNPRLAVIARVVVSSAPFHGRYHKAFVGTCNVSRYATLPKGSSRRRGTLWSNVLVYVAVI